MNLLAEHKFVSNILLLGNVSIASPSLGPERFKLIYESGSTNDASVKHLIRKVQEARVIDQNKTYLA
ncbi:hypothetical protein Y032_1055g3506 [Ancylostoma ceylanicum]|uniref:Uncharacterized protein n=1 Tax=Ancylostoma ceylanicum TaxID=53326 RepID=A0A016W8V7_9BILA|nr:hypothetical protein Y032_1055g3506 [Ancylostoma ceylanicum]